jgi:tyrosyl-DNA phosphodiesterase 2
MAAKQRDELRILTWNVWFGGYQFDERCAALVAELERRRPHVIALQEVTPALLEVLRETPWVEGYYATDLDGSTIGGYGVLILTRLSVLRQDLLPLPSRMGRKLLVTELNNGLAVATVHLESTADRAAVRVEQLELIMPYLATLAGDVALVGDMNFSPSDAAETAAIDDAFVDVWPALRADEPGFTADSVRNRMRGNAEGYVVQKRIDRVFLRGRHWQPRSIELVGTSPIDADGTFASDHFGLEVTLAHLD